MRTNHSTIRRILALIPGKKRFGVYRFLPVFFCLGAALEYSMVNWTVGETNFYRTFKKRQAKNYVEEKFNYRVTGVSWSQYLKFTSCALLSMMAGSQLVHIYYKPLQDLDLYIDQEMKENLKTYPPEPKSNTKT